LRRPARAASHFDRAAAAPRAARVPRPSDGWRPAEEQRRRRGCDRPHAGATAPARRPGSTRSAGMSTALKRLTAEQRAHFDAHGYVAPVDAFSSEEAAEGERRLVA